MGLLSSSLSWADLLSFWLIFDKNTLYSEIYSNQIHSNFLCYPITSLHIITTFGGYHVQTKFKKKNMDSKAISQ